MSESAAASMATKATVTTATSRWIGRFSFILNVGVEACSVVSPVPDDLVAAVREQHTVFTLHRAPVAALLLLVVVTTSGISHRVLEVVWCGLYGTKKNCVSFTINGIWEERVQGL
jgi:hypothetical protein